MSVFQRRLDLLDFIPRYPRKVSSRHLLDLLEGNGHENLTMRTIQRDLEAIEKLGLFGLEVDKRSKPFGWSINLNWKKLNISLMDANSALAFATLNQVADTLLPDSTLTDLKPYFDKAQTIIANEQSPLISHWKNSVALISTPSPVIVPPTEPDVLKQIKQAIFHKKQISAELRRYLITNQKPIWKHYSQINPLGLIQKDNVTTLVCTIGSFHQKVYKLPLAYIKNVELKTQAVVEPEHFDFEHIKQSYHKTNSSNNVIKLEMFVKKTSYLVLSNGKLSDDQSLTETDDPEQLKLSATVSDSPQLRAFLRGLGNNIEVLAPNTLRSYFKDLALAYIQKYAH